MCFIPSVFFCSVPFVPSSCMYACLHMLRYVFDDFRGHSISSFHTPPPWGIEIFSLGILTLALPSFGVSLFRHRRRGAAFCCRRVQFLCSGSSAAKGLRAQLCASRIRIETEAHMCSCICVLSLASRIPPPDWSNSILVQSGTRG